MPLDKNGVFHPRLFKKQAEVLNDQHRYLLMSGPRYCGKTLAGLHALVWHMWRTPNARVSVFGRTVTDSFDAGCWSDLVQTILPEWFEAGFMKYISPPKMSGLTHKYFMITNNAFGGESLCQLDSCPVEEEAERKLKGRRFSMIYMSEASNFHERKTWDVAQECLRCPWLKPEQHRMILDTNPADEGTESWLYQLFWNTRLKDNWDDVSDERTRKALEKFQKDLHVIDFTIDDNIFLTAEQKEAQRAKYFHDPDLYARYYEGKWVKASSRGAFADVFFPSRHVIGDDSPLPNTEPDILLPSEKCSELITGWDIGSANTAIVTLEKLQVPRPDKPDETWSTYQVLDELIVLKQNIPLEELVRVFVEKMAFWEEHIGNKVLWRHWSDRSSFDKYNNIADRAEHIEVYNESGGKIQLMAAAKSPGSVESRKKLLRKLLHQDRIILSRHKAPQTIDAIKGLPNTKLGLVEKRSPFKHAFDALTYALSMESYGELEEQAMLVVGKPEKAESPFVLKL